MFAVTKGSNVATLTAPPELDARNATEAKDELKALVAGGHHRLVIDLSDVTFVDSAGLGALLTGLKAARTAGGDVRLAGLAPGVRSIFELTRLYQVFAIFPDRVLAAASFES